MIEQFAADARRALAASEREARLLQHRQVATEHVLLGLLRIEDSVAARALRLLGVTYRKARRRIVRLVDSGGERVDGSIPFTPRVREVVEDAFSGAIWLPLVMETSLERRPSFSSAPRLRIPKPREVRSEELLFALLAHREGVAAHVLGELGVDLETLALAIRRVQFPNAAESVLPWPPAPPR